ncbi:hypothetical protein V6N13_029672 [Hibiscus sabdariffa]|uniref:Auxin-responsive protein n=1 Tax=Hibiscus sabdariffa TaxID=183260 RepID=A0ABR2AUQ2_9ROSI
MFGIEGKLEDPLRLGWQLVFVNRDNDILLLGDDPWDGIATSTSQDRIMWIELKTGDMFPCILMTFHSGV